MYNNTRRCMIIHINGHLLYSALDLVKFTGFQETKTNVNKRLLITIYMQRLLVRGVIVAICDHIHIQPQPDNTDFDHR